MAIDWFSQFSGFLLQTVFFSNIYIYTRSFKKTLLFAMIIINCIDISHQTVSHHHLVPIIMAASCHDYGYIAMPYYPRGDLIELCGKQEPWRVSRYMSHVARAVEKLHRHRIAHNDIKLENVFLDGSDRAILGDLGLARIDTTGTIDADLVGGTRDYWPPEKLAGHTRLNPFKVRRFLLLFVILPFYSVSPRVVCVSQHYRIIRKL